MSPSISNTTSHPTVWLQTSINNVPSTNLSTTATKIPVLKVVTRQPPIIPLRSYQEIWLEQVHQLISAQIDNSKYKVSDLSYEMAISSRQFTRKLKKITGLTPNKYIREIKLQKALLLLEKQAKSTVAEIAYAVGFEKPDYFSSLFEERFGRKPSSYLYC